MFVRETKIFVTYVAEKDKMPLLCKRRSKRLTS